MSGVGWGHTTSSTRKPFFPGAWQCPPVFGLEITACPSLVSLLCLPAPKTLRSYTSPSFLDLPVCRDPSARAQNPRIFLPSPNFCDPERCSARGLTPLPVHLFRCRSGDGCLPQPLLGYEHRRSPGDHHGHAVLQRQNPRVSVVRCRQDRPWLPLVSALPVQAALSPRERGPDPKGLHPAPGRGWESTGERW